MTRRVSVLAPILRSETQARLLAALLLRPDREASIAELAGTYHLPFAPHDCTGPVTAVANIHLAAAMPNCLAVEVVRGFINGYYRDVLDLPLTVEHGTVAAPSRPGLGAALASGFTDRPDVTVRVSS